MIAFERVTYQVLLIFLKLKLFFVENKKTKKQNNKNSNKTFESSLYATFKL